MTSSTIPSADFTPGLRERDMREWFEPWLATVVDDPSLHSRFVHTLSLLEHIGSVRIARTQSGMSVTSDVLEHLAEETRHAHYLKRLASRIDPELAEHYAEDQLLAGPAARTYFVRLDACSRRFVRTALPAEKQSAGTYLLVSWLVERRAMWLYPTYQELLRSGETGLSVRTIINDETGHLEEMTEGLDRLGLLAHPELGTMVECEENLFYRLAEAFVRVEDRVAQA